MLRVQSLYHELMSCIMSVITVVIIILIWIIIYTFLSRDMIVMPLYWCRRISVKDVTSDSLGLKKG